MQQEKRERMGRCGWEQKGPSCAVSAAGKFSKGRFTHSDFSRCLVLLQSWIQLQHGARTIQSSQCYAPCAGLLKANRNMDF